jgi:hypothetical protein
VLVGTPSAASASATRALTLLVRAHLDFISLTNVVVSMSRRSRQQQPDLEQLSPSDRILYDAILALQLMVSTRLAQLEGTVAALVEKKQHAKLTQEQRVSRRCVKIREAAERNLERRPELAKLLPAAERFFSRD